MTIIVVYHLLKLSSLEKNCFHTQNYGEKTDKYQSQNQNQAIIL